MTQLIDSRLLHAFSVVAEELHFGRAAKRLFMTQPPLSQSIRRLESLLGVPLLERSTRTVRLTPAGQELHLRVQRLASESLAMVQAVQAVHRGLTGRLTIGLTPSAAYTDLSGLLHAFRQQYPDVALELHEMNSSEMPQALQQQRLDVAFVRPPFADPDMAPVLAYAEPLVLALRQDHPAAGTQPITLRQAMALDLIGYDRQRSRYFNQILQLLAARVGTTARIVQESMIPTIMTMVEAGIGAAIVPASLARMRRDTLCYRPLRGLGGLQAELLLARLPDNANPAIANLTDMLRTWQRARGNTRRLNP